MRYSLICLMAVGFALFGCSKDDYLDEPYDKSVLIPTTIADMQALLDNAGIMNGLSADQMGVVPAIGEARCDDYFLINLPKTVAGEKFRNLYLWKDDQSAEYQDWNYPYRAILYANVVLETAAKIQPKNAELAAYNNAKGSAYFYRAFMLHQLTQIFTAAYDSSSATHELGAVLRLSSDMNEDLHRSTLHETYEQIIKDLETAISLLPDLPLGGIPTRPSKIAGQALLARTYLTMRAYKKALYYSNACLTIYNKLMDYNDAREVRAHDEFPFLRFNKEVVFHACLIQTAVSPMFSKSRHRIDSVLYKLYDGNDLRRSLFFVDRPLGMSFRGSYDQSDALFAGIATDEVYLMRAECNARTGHVDEALIDLNALLHKRYKTGTYVPITITDPAKVLQEILKERRKELLLRGLRWLDLRRLNKEGANITLKRILDGDTAILAPNAFHYTYLIPEDVIEDMPQNRR